jgi:hypothetical protein
MTRSPDYLYDLLPMVHRMRDAEQGTPLRDLLRVIGEQVNVLEEDIARLYANWFIETCDDWVVPYIGELVGFRPVATAPQRHTLVPRRDVANTIGSRRRKGTLALLEDLGGAVAGWPSRAVESYPLLGWTQHVDHPRLTRGGHVDLRSTARLDHLGGPFDGIPRGIDVRRPSSHRAVGLFNVPSVALHLWRLAAYPVTGTPAACIEREGTHCYTFSVLGNDTPLFHRPTGDAGGVLGELDVPGPIRRRAFEHRLSERPLVAVAAAEYYGPGRSLAIEVVDWPRRGRRGLIRREDVIPADLSDWHGYTAPAGKVLVDPVRGRLVFAPGQAPKRVFVRYHYGFAADLGGGEYRRPLTQAAEARLYRVRQRDTRPDEHRTIAEAYARWQQDKQEDGRRARAAVIEVADSGVYEERLVIELGVGESLQLRAAALTRPVLRLLDYRVDQPDPFTISGGAASRFVLDGFLVTGRGIEIAGVPPARENGSDSSDEKEPPPVEESSGDLCDVTIRHCTLVPGWELSCDCSPSRPDEPSLTITYSRARVVVEHSIIGSVHVWADERGGDPAALSLCDCIVDASSSGGLAIGTPDGRVAFVDLRVVRCTVVGAVQAHAITLAENTIFTAPVLVARRQVGCMRYCFVPEGSRTPPRYRCQPDVAAEDAAAELPKPVDPAARERVRAAARARVRPVFESLRYGTPGYGRLGAACPEEISRGADDESELGVFHDLYQPQRMDGLRVRLDEYTPAGMDAGIFPAT